MNSKTLFAELKYCLMTVSVAYIVWLAVHCFIRVEEILLSNVEHSLKMGIIFQIVMISLYELIAQFMLLYLVHQDNFIFIGACITLISMGIVYHPTQVLKSALEWICLAFCLLVVTLATIYIYALYRKITGSASQVQRQCSTNNSSSNNMVTLTSTSSSTALSCKPPKTEPKSDSVN